MPVQINEVIIRATVGNSSGSTAGTTAGATANAMDNTTLVEQIMETIRNKNER